MAQKYVMEWLNFMSILQISKKVLTVENFDEWNDISQ